MKISLEDANGIESAIFQPHSAGYARLTINTREREISYSVDNDPVNLNIWVFRDAGHLKFDMGNVLLLPQSEHDCQYLDGLRYDLMYEGRIEILFVPKPKLEDGFIDEQRVEVNVTH